MRLLGAPCYAVPMTETQVVKTFRLGVGWEDVELTTNPDIDDDDEEMRDAGYEPSRTYENDRESGVDVWSRSSQSSNGPRFLVRPWYRGGCAGVLYGATDEAGLLTMLAPILSAAESMTSLRQAGQ